MLFQFCQLCSNKSNLLIINLQKYSTKLGYRRSNKKAIVNQKLEKCQKEKLEAQGQKPIITCRRSEFDFYDGFIYSKHQTMPMTSRGWFNERSKGDYFYIHPREPSKEETNEPDESFSFEQFGLHPELCKTIKRYGLTNPVDVQRQGIPQILAGQNTILATETGCGKTLAYLLPLLHQVCKWKNHDERNVNTPLGLVVLPSRELTLQVGREFKRYSKRLDINVKTLIGGRTKRKMVNPSVQNVDIIIASFGVISKLSTIGLYKLNQVKHVVFDEADALFHETFEEKLKIFIKRIGQGFIPHDEQDESKTQVTLASATFPSRMNYILDAVMNVHSFQHVTSDKLHRIHTLQKFIRIGKGHKPMALLKYLKPKWTAKESMIIFANNGETCRWISTFLNKMSISHACLTGKTNEAVRKIAFKRFCNNEVFILVATNAGSRGLDTTMVRHILNYDFPLETADYIHRCGRTGRIGSPENCEITNFVSGGAEIALVMKIEYAIRKHKPIPIVSLLPIPSEKETLATPIMPDNEPKNRENSRDDVINRRMDLNITDCEDCEIDNLDDVENIPY